MRKREGQERQQNSLEVKGDGTRVRTSKRASGENQASNRNSGDLWTTVIGNFASASHCRHRMGKTKKRLGPTANTHKTNTKFKRAKRSNRKYLTHRRSFGTSFSAASGRVVLLWGRWGPILFCPSADDDDDDGADYREARRGGEKKGGR